MPSQAHDSRNAARPGARPIRNPKSKFQNKERGAAFLIAIAILVILVAIGTTFFSVSRLELKTATNVTNAVRVDLLNDAANAIAIHHLNQYFFRSPEVTSEDHSYRSLFDGSAFVGKSWARRKDVGSTVGNSMLTGGLPEVDINRIQRAIDEAAFQVTNISAPVVLYWPDEGHKESLFRGSRSNNWLYIPRFQSATASGFDPFYPTIPDYILLYDVEGNMADVRANPPDDATRRTIELRHDDGQDGGLGTLVAASPVELANLNAAIAALPPTLRAEDVQLYYLSDMDPNNTNDATEAAARYAFATTALYQDDVDSAAYASNPNANFNTTVTGYPVEQVDKWADLDNDGDGLRDSIWIPIPEDLFFPLDGIDNDLDGILDESQSNGIDDDLDTRVDYQAFNANGEPIQNPDGVILHDQDEAIEPGTFVYNGLGPLVEVDAGRIRVGDRYDNDGNGLVDEGDPNIPGDGENRLFLTSPLPGTRIPIDIDGDGVASSVETFRLLDAFSGEPIGSPIRVLSPALVLGQAIQVKYADPGSGVVQIATLTSNDVDAIDNDYDLLLNDFYAYAYLGPEQGPWLPIGNWTDSTAGYGNQISKSYADLSRDVWGFNPAALNLTGTFDGSGNGIDDDGDSATDETGEQGQWVDLLDAGQLAIILRKLRVTHSGEPVCELVGRAAIKITDEASKVNLNVAGAETFDPFDPDGQSLMRPAMGTGTTPHEYDLSTFPDIDVALASKIAGYRTGGPGGVHLAVDASDQTDVITVGAGDPELDNYVYDVSLPGYGRMDDNGDALLRALDGVDNDGNDVVDEGFVAPADLPAAFDEVIAFRDGDITRLELEDSVDTLGNGNRFTDPAQLAFAKKWFRAGSFEGIDEPAERQAFNPVRNELAESDGLDNDLSLPSSDAPNFTDEVGELGDRVFQSESELANVRDIGEGTLDSLARFATVHSSDRNVSFIPTENGVRAINKTDLNRASAKQLAAKLLLSSNAKNSLQLIDRLGREDVLDVSEIEAFAGNAAWAPSPVRFAEGLRQGDLRLTAHDPRPDGGAPYSNPNDIADGGFLFHRENPTQRPLLGASEMPLDQQLEFLQLAVNIADSRDAGHARSELSTERLDRIQKSGDEVGYSGNLPAGVEFTTGQTLAMNWPNETAPHWEIEEAALFPLEEIENQLVDVLNASHTKNRLQITDRWWLDRVNSGVTNPVNNSLTLPEQRHISYTAAGVESIRINELMVRPVRRVEAEAFPNSNEAGSGLIDEPLDPLDDGFAINQEKWNLDPSPFDEQATALLPGPITADHTGFFPHPTTDPTAETITYIDPEDSLTPEFAVQRQVLSVNYLEDNLRLDGRINPNFDTNPVAAPGGTFWSLASDAVVPLLGDRTGARTAGLANTLEPQFQTPVGGLVDRVVVPDVMEFSFSDIPAKLVGLPDGRYYLAVKLDNVDHNGDGVIETAEDLRQVISSGRLKYAMKYSNPNALLGLPEINRSIIDDIEFYLDEIDNAGAVVAQNDAISAYAAYLDNNFRTVPAKHLANGPDTPKGWVFLDATPEDIDTANPGYFMDFPLAYTVPLNGGIATARITTEFIGGEWLCRIRTDAPGATQVQLLDRNGIPVFTRTALQGFSAPLTDGQFAALLMGDHNIEVTTTLLPLIGPVRIKINPDDLDTTHAVTIPSFESGFIINIAFTTSRMPAPGNLQPIVDPDDIAPIAINFFDFSQEPDHEYIELANVSDDTIDLTGWKLEVGPEHKEGVEYYPFSSEWLIPDGTTISPGGMLLLAFNKWDAFDQVNGGITSRMPAGNESNLINHNGIGMARTNDFSLVPEDDIPDLLRVSVPPMADNSTNPSLYNPLTSYYADPTGSVFDRSNNPDTARSEFVDYIDDFGAGLTTAHAYSDGVALGDPEIGVLADQQRVDAESALSSSFSPVPNYPWDRIVELVNLRLWQNDDALLNPTSGGNVTALRNIDTVDQLARFVLRGGVLPNYPEQDGYDNDGDGGYLSGTADYVPGILETDMLDNDLDGFVDERVQLVDIDGDGNIDLPIWPFSSEGVDEGRLGLNRLTGGFVPGGNAVENYRSYGAGSFEVGTLPAIFTSNRLAHDTFFNDPITGLPFDYVAGGVSPVVDAEFFVDLVPQFAFAGLNRENWDLEFPPIPPYFGTIAAGVLEVDVPTQPAAITVAELVLSGSRILPRQTYLVQMEVLPYASGQIRLNFGDTSTNWITPTRIPDAPPRVFQEVVLIRDIGDSVDDSRVKVEVLTGLAPMQCTVQNIRIIPIDTANTPGSSFAVGITNEVIPFYVAGAGTQSYGTDLGTLSGTEYDILSGGLLADPATPANLKEDALYLGSDMDPLDWKAFTERRMYPGDSVVVSLYDGSGAVADRVTYREYDVINRTIDDVVGSPYFTQDFHDLQPGIDGLIAADPITAPYASLHPDYPTLWLPNQMGLDFYRSLERKDPQATGDRFGTQNRWQATDGNYDDWADSISVFTRNNNLADPEYRAFPSLTEQLPGYAGGGANARDFLNFSRFYEEQLMSFAGGQMDTDDQLRLYGHAIWGTPLRMNTAHRQAANPIDPLRIPDRTTGLNTTGLLNVASNVPGFSFTQTVGQFFTTPRELVAPGYPGPDEDLLQNVVWQQRNAATPVLNEPYNSAMELGAVSHRTYEHQMLNVSRVRLPEDTYLHDITRLNFVTNASVVGGERPTNNISQRSALVTQAEALDEGSTRPLSALLNAGATDSLVLTVSQANFIPIRPNPQQLSLGSGTGVIDDFGFTLPDGQAFEDLFFWRNAAGDASLEAEPPAAWAPVFLFADAADELETPSGDFRRFPYYPPYPNGAPNSTITMDPKAVLFPANFFFGTDLQRSFYPFFTPGNVAAAQVGARWPLDKRIAMYVSKRRNQAPGLPMEDTARPEALWVWDGEDGLENGEYEVYIGTWIPGLSTNLANLKNTIDVMANPASGALDLLTSFTPPPITPTASPGNAAVTEFAINNIADRDPVLSPEATSAPFTAEYEIDLLTEPTDALGVRARGGNDTFGLVHPQDWQPSIRYRAGEDGYIFYGTDAANGWQPLIVRVTDNFLALRVRNVGTTLETGAISHIVLAPRKRTPGRMNVNTTHFQIAKTEANLGQPDNRAHALVHPLAGLPGIVDLGGEAVFPAQKADRGEVSNALLAAAPTDGSLAEPRAMRLITSDPDPLKQLGALSSPAGGNIIPPDPYQFGIFDLVPDPTNPQNNLPTVRGVLENAALPVNTQLYNAESATRYLLLSLLQLGRTEYQDGRYYKNVGDLGAEESAYQPGDPVATNVLLYPLSNNTDPERRAAEIDARLRRIAGSLSVRSDVFEIIATVQAGYGIDANNDGRLNYRDNNEFLTTAETSSRMVYERRVPADSSDEADVSTQ